jgi:uncharacterized protein YndB with AHSA1/START domain
MQSTTETFSLTKELRIAARRETVWKLLVDPDEMTRWMGRSAALETWPGGLYRVEVLPGHTARGEVVEIDPPRRLVFTFGWEPGAGDTPAVAAGSSTVEIELEEDGSGTLLRFTHSGLPTEDTAASHTEGWDHYLGRLVAAAEGGDPGRDPWLEHAA